jgi:hypothetical protein
VFLVGIGTVLLRPRFALGQTIRCQRRIGLDLRVENDAGFDRSGLDGKVRLGLGGKRWAERCSACDGAH